MNTAFLTMHWDESKNNVYSLIQLCHFASIFGEIDPTPVRWFIYLFKLLKLLRKMFTNPLENYLAAEATFQAAFLATSIMQCSCQDYCFSSSAQGNLQVNSHDYQVVREELPLEGKKFSGRFKNSSIILLVVVNDQPLKSPMQKTRWFIILTPSYPSAICLCYPLPHFPCLLFSCFEVMSAPFNNGERDQELERKITFWYWRW